MKFVCMLIAMVSAYYISKGKPELRKITGTAFELTNRADPYNPNSYILTTFDLELDCPNSGYVCGIVVPYYDIYTSGPYNGKPKVNIITGALDELSDNINTALTSASDPTVFFTHNRIIYETEL